MEKLYLLLFFATSAASCGSEANGQDSDSLRIFHAGEIIVEDGPEKSLAPLPLLRLGPVEIQAVHATVVSEVVRTLPGARVQTNSRGESLLYIRGAGERQVATYLDGASLNIPWDNRVDLSLIPASLMAQIEYSNGIPSVMFGANSAGGGVNFSTFGRLPGIKAGLSYGTNNWSTVSSSFAGYAREYAYALSGSYETLPALTLPSGTDLTFHQNGNADRLNSDRKTMQLSGDLSRSLGAGYLGIGLNYLRGEKGVPPEGFTQSARFWRYPKVENLFLRLFGAQRLGVVRDDELRGSVWWSRFGQTINLYSSSDYRFVQDRETDLDRSLGSRMMYSATLTDDLRLQGASNLLLSDHDQTDESFDNSGLVTSTSAQTFRQIQTSHAIEMRLRLSTTVATDAGFAYNTFSTPLTGDKPTHGALSDADLTAGLSWNVSSVHSLHFAVGRKGRFPTLRELYGEAIRRFIPNPNLSPERSYLSEVRDDLHIGDLKLSAALFYNRVDQAIDQRRFDTLGSVKRQRINLDGSRTFGGELRWNLTVMPEFEVRGNLTLMQIRGLDVSKDSIFFLSEKPEALGHLVIAYAPQIGVGGSVSGSYTGVSYSPGNNGELETLADAAIFSAEVNYTLPISSYSLKFFVKGENVFDTALALQRGLPEAGRMLRAGLEAAF